MVVVINRNDNTFSPEIADELNAAFSSINNKIRAYKSEPLEYKETVQEFNNSDSFKAGNVLSIRESFVVENEFSEFTKIKNLPTNLPFEVWTKAITDNNESLQVYMNGQDVYIYGILSYYPQNAYISTDICIPT